MKTVNSRIKLRTPIIRKLDTATTTTLEKTLEALHNEVLQKQVMPFDIGTMQNDSTFPNYRKSKRGKVQLVTSTPYARRLYFHPEYHFQIKENKHAQGDWYEPWISGEHKDFCKKAFTKFYKKETGV